MGERVINLIFQNLIFPLPPPHPGLTIMSVAICCRPVELYASLIGDYGIHIMGGEERKKWGSAFFPATWKVEIRPLLQFRGHHCPIFFTWYFNVRLTQGTVSILHLLFLITAGPAPQSDLEEFIRNWQLQEGCSFPSVCRGLVLTHTFGHTVCQV